MKLRWRTRTFRLGQSSSAHDARGVSNSRASWRARTVIDLRFEHSAFGSFSGEVAPLPHYSLDTLEACEAALAQMPSNLPILDSTESLATWLEQQSPALPALRFGLETAYLAFLAFQNSCSRAALLREYAAARDGYRQTATRGRSNSGQSIETCQLLQARNEQELRRQIDIATAVGFRHLKWKLGCTGKALQELDWFIELVSPHAPWRLRLDANGSLTSELWPQVDARLATLGRHLEFIEQPFPGSERPTRSPAQSSTGHHVSVAIDEGLQTVTDDRGFVSTSPFDVYVYKPAALGGVLRGLRLARMTQARGHQTVVSHLFDGPVGFAANVDLALALDGLHETKTVHGLAPHPGLGGDELLGNGLRLKGPLVYRLGERSSEYDG